MSLGTFAAGPYSSAVVTPGQSSAALGLTQDGWVLEWTVLEQELDKSDLYGRSLIESFHQGLRVNLTAIFHEWKALEVRMLTPHANMLPVGVTALDNGITGVQATDKAFSIVMTALPNTPAATVGPATMTATYVKLTGNAPVQSLLGPEKRMGSFRGNVFPYIRSGAVGGVSYLVAT